MDILGSLIKTAYADESGDTRKSSSSPSEKTKVENPVLSDSEILGNAFVMIVAGHETTANVVHFSLVELARNSSAQHTVQEELQSIFGDSDPETWHYESNINKLLGEMVGAVMNEHLRLMPPIIAIPKSVTPFSDQVLVIDGKNITLPAGAHVALCSVSAQRNPKYWPTQPSKISKDDDLDDFRPERWLQKADAQQTENANELEDDSEFDGFTGQDTHLQLFRQLRGAYFPFSDGSRSCLAGG